MKRLPDEFFQFLYIFPRYFASRKMFTDMAYLTIFSDGYLSTAVAYELPAPGPSHRIGSILAKSMLMV